MSARRFFEVHCFHQLRECLSFKVFVPMCGVFLGSCYLVYLDVSSTPVVLYPQQPRVQMSDFTESNSACNAFTRSGVCVEPNRDFSSHVLCHDLHTDSNCCSCDLITEFRQKRPVEDVKKRRPSSEHHLVPFQTPVSW